MFQMYADGYGQKTIAWTLNGNAAQRELLKRYFVGKQPRPPRADKPSGAKDWSPHTIHDMRAGQLRASRERKRRTKVCRSPAPQTIAGSLAANDDAGESRRPLHGLAIRRNCERNPS